jgi:hypothetical protein
LQKAKADKALRQLSLTNYGHEKLACFWEIKKWFKAMPVIVL